MHERPERSEGGVGIVHDDIDENLAKLLLT
jgi:hypothetical protein